MLIIGSTALLFHFPELAREIHDTDIICTLPQFRAFLKTVDRSEIVRCVPIKNNKMHVRLKTGWNYEFEIVTDDCTGAQLMERELGEGWDDPALPSQLASPEALLTLKLSHRYLKNSPHFLKTMQDIQFLRSQGVTVWSEDWLKEREAETYVYDHPRLDVTSKDFFTGDGVQYVFEHDSIHLAVAICQRERVVRTGGPSDPGKLVSYGKTEMVSYPAYTFYMKDGSEVMTSKEKFFKMPEQIRLHGVYEESCVLALERSQIPHNLHSHAGPDVARPTARWSFEMALMKVCTSITSGWFREYAWENYQKVLDLYNELGENDYLERFTKNQHLLTPYKGDNQ